MVTLKLCSHFGLFQSVTVSESLSNLSLQQNSLYTAQSFTKCGKKGRLQEYFFFEVLKNIFPVVFICQTMQYCTPKGVSGSEMKRDAKSTWKTHSKKINRIIKSFKVYKNSSVLLLEQAPGIVWNWCCCLLWLVMIKSFCKVSFCISNIPPKAVSSWRTIKTISNYSCLHVQHTSQLPSKEMT